MQQAPAPYVDPHEASRKRIKVLRGCSMFGCGFSILLMLGGVVLVAFGLQRATQEALPFGMVLLTFAGIMGFIFAVWFGIAAWKMKQLDGR